MSFRISLRWLIHIINSVDKTKLSSEDIVFWPGMYSVIKAIVERCTVCAEFQAKNASQPMQSHQIPDRPWSKVATNLFTVSGNNYITIVDSFSDFVEVSELEDTTSHAVIQVLKEQFSRHGIPDTVISENSTSFHSPGNLTMSHPHHTTQSQMVRLNLQLKQSKSCSRKQNEMAKIPGYLY